MPAIDTNVLVRFLTGDNPGQYKASLKLFSSERIFIPDTVMLESEWVLRAAYDLGPEEINEAFRRLLGLENITVSDNRRTAQALAWHGQGLDFADAFHLACSQDEAALKTFDGGFIKQAKSLGECRVEKP